MTPVISETNFPGLKLRGRGKVRDIYEVGDKLLIVATDRLSAFDVVLPTPIPDKGKVLTQLSLFWFEKLKDVVPNHIIASKNFGGALREFNAQLEGRTMLCRKTEPAPVECVVRGYISGSGWKDYQKTGGICGIPLPAGLRESDKLPEPIFTPSTKATTGHDENISFDETVKLVGGPLAEKLRSTSLEIYKRGVQHAATRGIIIADTKFEFGLDNHGQLYLMDEALTADSSRFWPADQYQVGTNPPSFDKQFVRDWLETQPWKKEPPAPKLPDDVVTKTGEKYQEALERLTGHKLA